MAKRIVSLTVNGRRREEAVGDSTLMQLAGRRAAPSVISFT